MDKLKRRSIVFSLVTLVFVSAMVFLFADRIIDGPFPQMSKGKRFFDEREPALNAFVQRLESDSPVERVVCYVDDVWIEGADGGPNVEQTDQLVADYLALCRAAGASSTWRVDDGYLFYMGPDSRAGRDFQVAFIWRSSHADGPPECSAVEDLRDFGNCVVPLSDKWVLDYEWMPTDYDSPREKELMELAEDVVREASTKPSPEP